MDGTLVASGDPAESWAPKPAACRGVHPRTVPGGNTHLLNVHVADPSRARCQVRIKV